MLRYTEEKYQKISKIIYIDDSYYYGEFSNGLKNGYGKYCNKDGVIIKAGFWENDICKEKMNDADIEEILSTMY